MIGKPDPERDKRIVEYYLNDSVSFRNAITTTAEEFSLTTERVRQILIRAGVRKPKWTWSSPELVSKIYKLAEEGMSHSAIAREVGLSRERIRVIIKTGR